MWPGTSTTATYIATSCSAIVPGRRSVVLRSPSHSSEPETTNRTASAAWTTACAFWPALKRPCGHVRAAQPAEVVGVEALELAPRAPERAAVPSTATSSSAVSHAVAATRCIAFISGRLDTTCASTGR